VPVAVTGFIGSRPEVTETRDVAERADTGPATSGREVTASGGEGGRSEVSVSTVSTALEPVREG